MLADKICSKSPSEGQTWNSRGRKGIYLTHYDTESNTNIITGELSEVEELKILPAWAGCIRVAGGQHVSTEYGMYRAIVGPSRDGEYDQLDCKGMKSIAGEPKKHSLQEVNKELRDSGLINPNAPSQSMLEVDLWAC